MDWRGNPGYGEGCDKAAGRKGGLKSGINLIQADSRGHWESLPSSQRENAMTAITQRMRIPLTVWNWPEQNKLAEGRGRWRLGPRSIFGLCPGEKLFCSSVYAHFRRVNCPSSLTHSLFSARQPASTAVPPWSVTTSVKLLRWLLLISLHSPHIDDVIDFI